MVWIPEEIHRSKILVVGAGGIGCELLKNLVLSGFIYRKIDILKSNPSMFQIFFKFLWFFKIDRL